MKKKDKKAKNKNRFFKLFVILIVVSFIAPMAISLLLSLANYLG